jgi:hypothetical protein
VVRGLLGIAFDNGVGRCCLDYNRPVTTSTSSTMRTKPSPPLG